jgi:hypothetical protein
LGDTFVSNNTNVPLRLLGLKHRTPVLFYKLFQIKFGKRDWRIYTSHDILRYQHILKLGNTECFLAKNTGFFLDIFIKIPPWVSDYLIFLALRTDSQNWLTFLTLFTCLLLITDLRTVSSDQTRGEHLRVFVLLLSVSLELVER